MDGDINRSNYRLLLIPETIADHLFTVGCCVHAKCILTGADPGGGGGGGGGGWGG